jgi:hypothetical protein
MPRFASEDVQKALLSGARGAIGLCLVQWSSYDQQEHVVPWTYLDSREMIGVFSLLLKGMERQFSSNTGIGAALRYCANYLDEAPYRAERAVIDISGDGHDNQPIVIGDRVVPLPQIRDSIVARGIIINGMPILGVAEPLPRYKSLLEYYAAEVIGGSGSFIEPVENPDDIASFAGALRRKLVAEVA